MAGTRATSSRGPRPGTRAPERVSSGAALFPVLFDDVAERLDLVAEVFPDDIIEVDAVAAAAAGEDDDHRNDRREQQDRDQREQIPGNARAAPAPRRRRSLLARSGAPWRSPLSPGPGHVPGGRG